MRVLVNCQRETATVVGATNSGQRLASVYSALVLWYQDGPRVTLFALKALILERCVAEHDSNDQKNWTASMTSVLNHLLLRATTAAPPSPCLPFITRSISQMRTSSSPLWRWLAILSVLIFCSQVVEARYVSVRVGESVWRSVSVVFRIPCESNFVACVCIQGIDACLFHAHLRSTIKT